MPDSVQDNSTSSTTPPIPSVPIVFTNVINEARLQVGFDKELFEILVEHLIIEKPPADALQKALNDIQSLAKQRAHGAQQAGKTEHAPESHH